MDLKPVRKRVEFYSKNKFEKLVHLAGFIKGIYHDARSSESQIGLTPCCRFLLDECNSIRTAVFSSTAYYNLFSSTVVHCRPQWPRGLRSRSAAARLLVLLFGILPVAWMSVVSVVFCQIEVSATS